MLMHGPTTIDAEHPLTKELDALKRASKKLKKDDTAGKIAKTREINRAEWAASMYWSKEGFYIPGDNIFRCIVEAARKSKSGKRAEAAIVPIDDAPIVTPKPYPLNLDELYEIKDYVFRGPVRIPPKTGARVIIARAMIPAGWKTKPFEIMFDDSELPESDLVEALETAGRIVGIGAWRPKFGRFTVSWL